MVKSQLHRYKVPHQQLPLTPATWVFIYKKSGGKIYWRSFDVSETDLTSSGGGNVSSLDDLNDVIIQTEILIVTNLDTVTYSNQENANLNVSPRKWRKYRWKNLTISAGQSTGSGGDSKHYF